MNPLDNLRSAQEQDEAHAVKWWREGSAAEKAEIWDAIQKLGGTTKMELVSRFAQIGMTHVALLAGEP